MILAKLLIIFLLAWLVEYTIIAAIVAFVADMNVLDVTHDGTYILAHICIGWMAPAYIAAEEVLDI